MGNSRVKKYRMKPIPSAFSEKGGFNAQFVGDGFSIDARNEILPSVIRDIGLQIGEGAAWDLVSRFLMACSLHAATTGETVTVGSLLSFGLAIKGWYSNKDSKAAKDNVRVIATLLGDLRPAVAFTMSNETDGVSIALVTVMSEGCGLGHVRQGAAFRIGGKALRLLDGDGVTASLRKQDGETVSAECAVVASDDDHIDATLPAEFSDPAFVGREVRFTVRGRGGDPEAGTEEKSIAAVLDEGDAPSEPAPTITGAGTRGDDPGEVNVAGATLEVTGENLESATRIELLDDAGALWQTLPATFADGKLTAGVDFGDKPCDTGALRVTTAGGTATFAIRYAAH